MCACVNGKYEVFMPGKKGSFLERSLAPLCVSSTKWCISCKKKWEWLEIQIQIYLQIQIQIMIQKECGHSSSFWFCPLFCPLIHFPMYFALKFCPCPCPLFLPWTRGQKKRARAMAKFEGKIHGEMNQRAKKRFFPCPLFCWHFEGKGKTWGQKKGKGKTLRAKIQQKKTRAKIRAR